MVNLFQSSKAQITVTALVLSDDPVTRLRVAERLRAANCEVKTVETGESALTALDANGMPSVLICDFLYPDTDGAQFLERARLRYGRNGLAPTMFLLDSPEDEEVARKYGVNDVLAKPITTTALFACINNLLAAQGVSLDIPKEFDDAEPAARTPAARIPLIGRLNPLAKFPDA